MRSRAFLAVSILFFSASHVAAAESTTTVKEVKPEAVLYGIDVLEEKQFDPLRGKQIGLITNQTGRDSRGRSSADVLAATTTVKLIALFSPEHGIRGTHEGGQLVGDLIDPKTHLPVYSLYGAIQRPTPPMLNAMDALVFDMQDVGARFYTYLTTMGMCMEAAARRNIPFVVLDRPNPAGGDVVEGQVLDWHIRHFTAYYNIPVRHGMTAGEIAQWYNKTANIHAKLIVVPMAGWKRAQLWNETLLSFIPPSPNIKTPHAALLYSGLGMFEATNVSVARGTAAPFARIGAPWMKGTELARRLNQLQPAGLRVLPTAFSPDSDLYESHLCSGIRFDIIDPHAVRPVDLFVQIACLLRDLSPKEFELRWDEIARVTGSRDFESMYKANKPAAEILEVFHKSAEKFKKDRQEFLLYQ
jgi:uncharacterized protein YbbC (DUF1343 family)